MMVLLLCTLHPLAAAALPRPHFHQTAPVCTTSPPCSPAAPHTGGPGVGLRLIDLGCAFGLTETDTKAVFCELQTLPWRAPEVRGCVCGLLVCLFVAK